MRSPIILALCLPAAAGAAVAAVQPAGVFTDNAVIQCAAPVRIWGTAASGENVTVAFAGQSKKTAANRGGSWMVALDPLPVCAQGRPLEIRGSKTARPVKLQNVVVGEVWLAGGQSNMASTMSFYRPRRPKGHRGRQ